MTDVSDGFLGNANLQRLLKAQAQVTKDRDSTDLREVLGTESGRRWYRKQVFTTCQLQLGSYDPDIKDGVCAGQHQAYIEGIRRVGLLLLADAQTRAPDLWIQLIQEGIAQDHADKAVRDEIMSAEDQRQ